MGKPRVFTTVPSAAIADTRLTALELRCLMVISLHDGMSTVKGSGGGCFASLATLAKLARTDVSNVSKAVSRLVKLGYVSREEQQMDRRKHTLRVLFDQGESWRVDQQFEPEKVGEFTNDPAEFVGKPTNDLSEIVGEGEPRTHANPPQTDTHYIPLNGEIDFDESRKIDSAEAAHRAFSAKRVEEDSDQGCSNPPLRKNGAEARLGKVEMISLKALLPKRWSEITTAAQLIQFERVWKAAGRNPELIDPAERQEFEDWLFNTADAFAGDQDGYHAERLMAELELAA